MWFFNLSPFDRGAFLACVIAVCWLVEWHADDGNDDNFKQA